MITSFFKSKKADSSGKKSNAIVKNIKNDQSGKESNSAVKNIKSDQSDKESIPVEKKIKDSKYPAGITLVKKTLVKKVRLHNEIEISLLFFKHSIVFAHCQYLVLLLIDPTIHTNNISLLQKLLPSNKHYLPNLLVYRKGKKGRAVM